MDKFEEMKMIRDELMGGKHLPLYEYRTSNHYFPVVGEGSHDAKILFVGEAPGQNEAKTGRPFCGRAGAILDKLLDHVKLPREKVYITNIVKDRPPGNRDPFPEEIDSYGMFLDRQISIIKPTIISTLGRFSMKYIFEKFKLENDLQPISKIHGQVFNTETTWGRIKIIPQYHPAVAIYNSNTLNDLKIDFEVLKDNI